MAVHQLVVSRIVRYHERITMEWITGVSLAALLQTVGLIGLFIIVFAESGLLIGFFLPGDSLLFTAGFLASQGVFPVLAVMGICFVAAVIGDNVGYTFGHRAGRRLFTRENSVFFHKDHLERARKFYDVHGGKTIILARFMPVVRTFAPILAGVGNMNYRLFFIYNIAGAFVWAVGMSGLGYFLGQVVPHSDRFIFPIILAIIVISFVPPLVHVLKEKRRIRPVP